MKRSLSALVAAVAVLLSGPLMAQGPAGNTHPQAEVLKAENVVNPFGAASTKSVDAATKKAFADKVDLTPLRDIAVYHNGRVKILGTLAGETVFSITGRKDFFDVVPEEVYGQTKWRKVKYDPLFTYMDIVIDPAFYDEKAVIGVAYHPLREDLLKHVWSASPLDPGQTIDSVVDSWMRLGRVTPVMVLQHGRHLSPNDKDGRLSQNKANALRDLEQALFDFTRLPATLMLVPAEAPDQPWKHLGSFDSQSPAVRAAKALGEAWRAADVPAANAAIKQLAEELPKVNPSGYPTTRRSLESLYNQARFFDYGMWLYCFATLFLLLAFGTGRPWLSKTGLVLLVAAILVHGAGFALRSYIAERYSIQNQFESMTGLSLFAAVFGLGLMIYKRQPIYAAASAAVGFLILIAATQTGIPGKEITREAAILNTSVLLKYHVTTVLLSYGLIALGFIVSVFYLATHYASRAKTESVQVAGAGAGGGAVSLSAAALNEPDDPSRPVGVHRVLADLDKAQMTILQLAFWVLGVGILLGAWWADHSWGRWWGFDPKEMWALATWIVYLVVVHVRVAGTTNKGLKTAWLSVLGFVAMLWCYFGVNLLLPGLHAYA